MQPELERISVKTSSPWFNLRAEAVFVGRDLLVYIFGGESPHIGAVAMAQPRPSLADPDITSASASVLTYVGHKEDLMARKMALELAAELGANVVVTAGAHWDNLMPDDLKQVTRNSEELLRILIDELKKAQRED